MSVHRYSIISVISGTDNLDQLDGNIQGYKLVMHGIAYKSFLKFYFRAL